MRFRLSLPRPPLLLSLTLLAGIHSAVASQIQGVVRSGETPIAQSAVQLFSAGQSSSQPPTLLGSARADARGAFAITFSASSDPDTVLYLVASGGSLRPFSSAPTSAAIRLASVIGPPGLVNRVVINERTTVAAAYALAQFSTSAGFAGPSPGLQNAAAIVRNLVNLETGGIGSVLGNSANGNSTSTMPEFNSLANMLAGCVQSALAVPCTTLFSRSQQQPSGALPTDTLQAALNIAHSPWQNPAKLYLQSKIATPYAPALSQTPVAWTLALTYEGNGAEFDGPGNIAFDSHGNAWISNNYEYNPSPFAHVCGDTHVLKLTPTGDDAPGAPYSGGGLYGAGFGIVVDPSDNAWVSNFRFQGSNCKTPLPGPPDYPGSVSQFSNNGAAISPTDGYGTYISQPQGTASDRDGNIWIANCGSDSVVKYPAGNASAALKFGNLGMVRPFDLATDDDGNVWITSGGNSQIFVLNSSGMPIATPFSDPNVIAPMGIAIDSQGNAWTGNSGGLELPCQGNYPQPLGETPSVSMLTRTGNTISAHVYHGGGITLPWGVAIDGNDNVFVANFSGQHLSEFCGVRPSTCPAGLNTGDPISPITGYRSDALTRNTGVAIDPSGNVWLANNWLPVAIQSNPGGHAAVVFIGLAAPIKTPLNGNPRQP